MLCKNRTQSRSPVLFLVCAAPSSRCTPYHCFVLQLCMLIHALQLQLNRGAIYTLTNGVRSPTLWCPVLSSLSLRQVYAYTEEFMELASTMFSADAYVSYDPTASRPYGFQQVCVVLQKEVLRSISYCCTRTSWNASQKPCIFFLFSPRPCTIRKQTLVHNPV